MITHEMLVSESVCQEASPLECDKFDSCKDCYEYLVSEYEEHIRAEAREKTIEEIEDIVDEINNQGLHCIDENCDDDNHDCAECMAKAILGSLARIKIQTEYEKEQMNG